MGFFVHDKYTRGHLVPLPYDEDDRKTTPLPAGGLLKSSSHTVTHLILEVQNQGLVQNLPAYPYQEYKIIRPHDCNTYQDTTQPQDKVL